MFFVVRSNDSFNFPLGLIKYIVIVKWERERDRHRMRTTWSVIILINHYIKYIQNSLLLWTSVPCSRGDLRFGVLAPFHAHRNSDQSPQRQKVRTGGLVEGRSGGLLSGEDAHSVWPRDSANIVVSRGHSRWCPAYVETEQALLRTTEVTRQQCSVSSGWQLAHQRSDVSCGALKAGPRCRMSLGWGRK